MSNRVRDAREAGAGRAGFVALGCVGFIATAGAPAFAQDGTPTRLEGVTVTDTAIEESYKVEEASSPKITAPLVDTPRIVNVITEDVLEDTATFSFQEALRLVPGITLGAGEGGVANADIPLIRGVDATADTFVDGARDVGSQTREIFAVERIEVFKGPNTAFGGRGAAGGAINIVSKVAREGNSIGGQATIGTDDFKRITVDANQEIADGVAVRIAALWHDADVPGRDAVYDDRWGVAPSITAGLAGPVTLTFSYYHFETDTLPDYGIPLTSPGQLPGGVRVPADVDYDNFYGLLARDFQKTNFDAASLILNADLGSGWTLSNTTRYSSAINNFIVTNPDDSAGNVAKGLVWRNTKSRNSDNDSFVSLTNLGGVFDTGGIGHSVALGFEFSTSDTYNLPYTVTTGNRACPPADVANFNCADLLNPNPSDPWTGTIGVSATANEASLEDYSLYAFDTITITPQILINAGVRWTSYDAQGSGVTRGAPFSVSADGDFWSYQGALIFKPTEATSLYVSYADSKNPPGGDAGEGSNNISLTNALYEPQSTENWEIGGKAEFFGGGLLLSAALFQVDRSNIVQTDPTGVVTDVFDEARLRGFEISAAGRVGPVTLTGGYTLVDSELRVEGPNLGNALPNTPKHNVAATATWEVTPQLRVGGGAYHASRRYADPANLISADGYWRFDANASYEFTDNLGLRLNVQNIGDERYVSKLRNPHFAVPGQGRQALLTLIARY